MRSTKLRLKFRPAIGGTRREKASKENGINLLLRIINNRGW